MGNILDLLGTSKKTFKLGKIGFTIDGSVATANRTLGLPDANVDLATGTTGQVLTKLIGGGWAPATPAGGAMDFLPVYNAAFAYSVNQYVTYSGFIYKCIQAGTGQTPSAGSAYWQQQSNDRYYSGSVDLSAESVIYGSVFCAGDLTLATGQQIYGDVIVFGNVLTNHTSGGSYVAIQGNLLCFNSVQFYGNNDVDGVGLLVAGDCYVLSNIQTYGGNASGGNNNGRTGGVLNASGTIICGASINTRGGNGSGTGQGGAGGNCNAVNGSLIVPNSSINCSAGSNGGSGNTNGNDSGRITAGSGLYCGSSITLQGASANGAANNGGSGGNITVTGGSAFVNSNININGGNAAGNGNAGNGGIITVTGDFICNNSVSTYGGNGGTSAGGNGGNGGNINVTGNIQIGNSINTYGTAGYAGGTSGYLNSGGDIFVNSSVNMNAGNSLGNNNNGGNCGYISALGDLYVNGGITGVGGNGDPNGGFGGYGMYFKVGGNSTVNGNVTADAGNSGSLTAGRAASSASHDFKGNLTVYGSTFQSNGGNAGATTGKGGAGAQLNVWGKMFCDTLRLNGGTGSGASQAGSCGTPSLIGGCNIKNLILNDGASGAANTDAAFLYFGDMNFVGSWNVQNKGSMLVRPFDFSYAASLQLSSATGKQTLTNNGGGQTATFANLPSRTYKYDPTLGTWRYEIISSYGSMYGDEINQNVVIGAISTYVEVGGSLSDGGSNADFTFQNSKELKCNVAGIFKIDWSMSINCVTNNQDLAGCAMKNGAALVNTTNHSFDAAGISNNIAVGGCGIVTLAVNDLVSLAVANHTAANNIEVEHANFTIIRVG